MQRKAPAKPAKNKVPIIRPNQRKPFTKCTAATVEARLEEIAKLLRKHPCMLKSELKRWIKTRYNLEWKSAEEYMARARNVLLLRLQEAKDELRAESALFYESVLSSKSEATQDKLRARERLDKLLGLEPKQSIELEHSGSILAGDAVDVELLKLPINVRRQVLDALRKARPALPEPSIPVDSEVTGSTAPARSQRRP